MKKIVLNLLMITALIFVPFIMVGCGGNSGPSLSSIEVLRVEKRKGYKAFEKFDETNMMIRANYSDGSFKNLSSGWTISYLSADGTNLHNDCFYAGENRVKIEYEGQSYIMSLYDSVEKVEKDLTVSIEEYAHIYTGGQINFPLENIKVLNSENQQVEADLKLVYCTSFEDYSNYQTTTVENGALKTGEAPSKEGIYKVFAIVNNGKNYKDIYSDVIEFNIFDENQTGLFATGEEEFFGWKEITPFDNTYDYIEFSVKTENDVKKLTYNSTFAESGEVLVYSDHIVLINETEKVQILLQNDKIYVQNNEIIFSKWRKPVYLGVYEMVISAEKANQLKYETNEDFVCRLEIYVDDENRNGEVNFKLKCLSIYTDQLSKVSNFEGKVTFIEEDGGKLTFIPDGGPVEFFAYNISSNEVAEEINLQFDNSSSSKISTGIYSKI